jgi:hypothetical protein
VVVGAGFVVVVRRGLVVVGAGFVVVVRRGLVVVGAGLVVARAGLVVVRAGRDVVGATLVVVVTGLVLTRAGFAAVVKTGLAVVGVGWPVVGVTRVVLGTGTVVAVVVVVGAGAVVVVVGVAVVVVLGGGTVGTGAPRGAPGGGGRVVTGIVVTDVVSWVTLAGVQLTVGPPKDQSITPWSPCSGGLTPSITSMMSPTRLKWKKASALAGPKLTQPWETFSKPWSATLQGAACTYSPLSEMWTSQ